MARHAIDVRVTGDSGLLSGASFAHVASGSVDVQGVAAQSGLRLMGYSYRGTGSAGVTNKAVLRHGSSAAGTPIAFLAAEDNQAPEPRWFGPQGIPCAGGIFVDMQAGDLELVIYYAVVTV